MFMWDQDTHSMKELLPKESAALLRATPATGTTHFRALVADDDDEDRFLTISHLGEAWTVAGPLTVECAADGAEALEKIHSSRYALVVLDWNMPEQDGAAVLRTIRANGLRVPVVVVSGQQHEAIANDLKAMDAAFVNKGELNSGNFRQAITASMQLQESRAPVDPLPATPNPKDT